MARIKESIIGNTPFERLLGHNSELLDGWSHLGKILKKNGQLSSELKEQVSNSTIKHLSRLVSPKYF